VVVKGHEILLWNKGGYLNTIMDIAHGVTTSTTTKDMPKVVHTTKGSGGVNTPPKASKNVVEHKPSPNYTCDYIVTLDHNGKMVVKYVGAYAMNVTTRISANGNPTLCTSVIVPGRGYHVQSLSQVVQIHTTRE
jgi:hypothetical protein